MQHIPFKHLSKSLRDQITAELKGRKKQHKTQALASNAKNILRDAIKEGIITQDYAIELLRPEISDAKLANLFIDAVTDETKLTKEYFVNLLIDIIDDRILDQILISNGLSNDDIEELEEQRKEHDERSRRRFKRSS